MAFIWTHESKVGDIAEISSLEEMQDNCDWLTDNQACITENSSVDITYYTTDDSLKDITVVPTGFITIYGTVQTGENAAQYSSRNDPFQTHCITANTFIYNTVYISMSYSGDGGCSLFGS